MSHLWLIRYNQATIKRGINARILGKVLCESGKFVSSIKTLPEFQFLGNATFPEKMPRVFLRKVGAII